MMQGEVRSRKLIKNNACYFIFYTLSPSGILSLTISRRYICYVAGLVNAVGSASRLAIREFVGSIPGVRHIISLYVSYW